MGTPKDRSKTAYGQQKSIMSVAWRILKVDHCIRLGLGSALDYEICEPCYRVALSLQMGDKNEFQNISYKDDFTGVSTYRNKYCYLPFELAIHV